MRPPDWDRAATPYPFAVRRDRLENFESFSSRTLAANFETPADQRELMRLAAGKPGATWPDVLSAKTGSDPNSFARTPPEEARHPDGTHCELCSPGISDAWMCRRCADGDSVRLVPHLERVVCLRHRVWVGSGCSPPNQPVVDYRFIKAERQLQSLRRRGVVTAWILWELLFAIDPTRQQLADRAMLPRAPFPRAVAAWTALSTPDFAARLVSAPTYRQSYHVLCQRLGNAGCDSPMCRRIWLLLRPAFLRLRDPGGTLPPHEFRFNLKPGSYEVSNFEPFHRYLDVGHARLTRHTWRGLIVPRNAGLHRSKALNVQAICIAGHRLNAADCTCVRDYGGRFRCCICENHSAFSASSPT